MSPTQLPRVLALGGLDPCGGAGIGADARTVHVCGGFALTVATCLTVQNRHGFRELAPVAARLLRDSFAAALADGPLHAVKLGLLGTPETAAVVADLLRAPALGGLPLVVDPVLAATAGGFAPAAALVSGYRSQILPRALVVTPNGPELLALAPERGAAELLALGVRWVALKDGHGEGAVVRDRLVGTKEEIEFAHPRLMRGPVHGTGCAFAAALATFLALGMPVGEAFLAAGRLVAAGLALTPVAQDGRPEPLRLPLTAPRTDRG